MSGFRTVRILKTFQTSGPDAMSSRALRFGEGPMPPPDPQTPTALLPTTEPQSSLTQAFGLVSLGWMLLPQSRELWRLQQPSAVCRIGSWPGSSSRITRRIPKRVSFVDVALISLKLSLGRRLCLNMPLCLTCFGKYQMWVTKGIWEHSYSLMV